MWQKTENSDPEKPLEFELSNNMVIIRKDFEFVPASDDMNDHWTYLEWQMTKEQYDVYKAMQN